MSEQGLSAMEVEQLHRNCAEIADLSDGLKDLIGPALEGDSKVTVMACILNRIIALAEEFI